MAHCLDHGGQHRHRPRAGRGAGPSAASRSRPRRARPTSWPSSRARIRASRPSPSTCIDPAAMAQAVRSIAGTLGPIDLAVLNAGIWEPMSARNFSAAKAARSMAVNYLGIANGIEALLPAMLERGQGHIAMVASVAGYRGLSPLTAAYGPTKAAVINLAESLRNDLARARDHGQRHQPRLRRDAHDQRQQVPDALHGLGRGRGAAHRPRPGEGQVRDRLPLAAGGADEARPPAAQPRCSSGTPAPSSPRRARSGEPAKLVARPAPGAARARSSPWRSCGCGFRSRRGVPSSRPRAANPRSWL